MKDQPTGGTLSLRKLMRSPLVWLAIVYIVVGIVYAARAINYSWYL